MDLLECRNEIDKIDKELVELFEKRMNVAVNVAKYKIENNIPIFNGAREAEVIQKNINRLNNREYSKLTEKFFTNLMELSRSLQADIIEDNDVVFLDISTTNHTIAMMLGATKKNLTIITNMNRIAMEFDRAPNVDVILIGGRYNKKLGGTVGSAAIEEIKKFKITKAFVGAGGINIEENFISNFNYDEAAVKKEILRCSKKRYIVANYEKLYKDGAYKFATLDDIDYIVTEKEPEGNIKEILNQKEVKVIC